MKTIRILAAALAAALLLTGCFGGDPAVAKAGRKLMEAYVSEQFGRGAKLESCDQLVRRPAADQLVSTSWVHGDISVAGGEKIGYWANTADGAIFTNERVPELSAATAGLLSEALGVPGAVAHVYPVLFTEEESLHGYLPVTVGDMRAWAAAALTDGDVILRISAGGPGAIPDELAAALAETWSGVSLTWYELPADALPTQAEADNFRFWHELEGESTVIRTDDYRE